MFETKESQQTVTGTAVGNITNSTKKEILYSCYSGVVKSICPRHAAKQIGVSENEVAIKPEVAKQEQEKQITELNQEIQDLEK